MHLDLPPYYFRFYQIFHGEGQAYVGKEKKYAGSRLAIDSHHACRGDHHQPYAEDWKKGQNRHDATPENGGVQVEYGKEPAGNDALNESTNEIPFQDGIGNFFKFGNKKKVFMVGERRKTDDKGNKLFLIDEQKEDDQNHHAEKSKKLQDISCPRAGLVIEKEAACLDER